MEGWCAVDPEIGILTLLLTSPRQPVAFSCRTNRAAPGFCSGVGYLATNTQRPGPEEAVHPVDVPAPGRPPSERGGEASVLPARLPPNARTSASVRSRLLWLIVLSKYCPTPLPAPAGTAFGRLLCKGVVSFCFGSIWQRGIHFWVSTK